MDTTTTDILSAAQMTETISQRRAMVEEAYRKLTTEIRRHDGTTAPYRWTDLEALAKARTESLASVESAESLALTRTRGASAEAQSILAMLNGVDLVRLSPEDEQRTAILQATIRDDAGSLPLTALEREFRTAIVRNDRAAIYLWAKYGRVRVAADELKGSRGTGPIRKMISQAGDLLRDSSLDTIRDDARALAAEAGDITRKVDKARQHRSGRPQFGGDRQIVRFAPDDRDPNSLGYD